MAADPSGHAGQVWRLPSASSGRSHWLIQGDCREPAVWARLMAAAGVTTAAGVFTSPPYAEQRAGNYGGVAAGDYVDWFHMVQRNAGAWIAPDGSFFLNLKSHTVCGERALYVYDLVLAMKRRWGWCVIDDLLWLRQGFPGRYANRFKNAHEPVYHFARSVDVRFRPEHVAKRSLLAYAEAYTAENNTTMGAAYSGRTGRNVRARNGLVYPSNVVKALTGAHDKTAVRGHGATFPVALPTFFLKAYSDPGDVWVDPCSGSGSMLVAAEETGRVGLGIEILAAECERTLERWRTWFGEPEVSN